MTGLTDAELTFLKMVDFGLADWTSASARDTAHSLEQGGYLRLAKRRNGTIVCALEPAGRAAISGGHSPARIELSRRRGFRLPPLAVKIDQTTPFGNPFRVEPQHAHAADFAAQRESRERFEAWLSRTAAGDDAGELGERRDRLLARLPTIRGCDLACWCRLCRDHADGRRIEEECQRCMPCHGDILLKVANDVAGDTGSPATSQ